MTRGFKQPNLATRAAKQQRGAIKGADMQRSKRVPISLPKLTIQDLVDTVDQIELTKAPNDPNSPSR